MQQIQETAIILIFSAHTTTKNGGHFQSKTAHDPFQ